MHLGPTCIFWANLTPFSLQFCPPGGAFEGVAAGATANDATAEVDSLMQKVPQP